MDFQILSQIIIFLKTLKLEYNDDETRVYVTKIISELIDDIVICDSINNDSTVIEKDQLIVDIPFSKTEYIRFIVMSLYKEDEQYNLFSDPEIVIDFIYEKS